MLKRSSEETWLPAWILGRLGGKLRSWSRAHHKRDLMAGKHGPEGGLDGPPTRTVFR